MEIREAGANPALPRNCKRGHSLPATGKFLGRPGAGGERRLRSNSWSQETGANCHQEQSLSRDKEDCMRVLPAVVGLTFMSASLFAADLKVKVLDPHSDGVANAQVALYRPGE